MTMMAWIVIVVIILIVIGDFKNKPSKTTSTLPPFNVPPHKTPPLTKNEQLKQQVLRKYDNRCCECGTRYNLQIHHLLEVRYGGQDNIDNMVLLCKDCHQKIHNREFTYERDSERKLINNEKLNKLWAAKKNGKIISIIYQKKDGTISERRIIPLDIHEWENRLYVRAHCYLRNAGRTFRVSRIKKIE